MRRVDDQRLAPAEDHGGVALRKAVWRMWMTDRPDAFRDLDSGGDQ